MTAVLILAFNRPGCAEQLATRLREINDLRIYLSIDGARPDRPQETQRVVQVREVLRDLLGNTVIAERDTRTNLGCADAVSMGLHWFFKEEPEGVILEDDCIPTEEFFEFTSVGLRSLRNDPTVGAICGVNYAPPSLLGGAPAARTRFFPIWGWAAWRRSIEGFTVRRKNWFAAVSRTSEWKSLSVLERRDWKHMFAAAGSPHPHTWDYQFVMHQWIAGRDAVVPSIPLVENIGFDEGTHFSGGAPKHYYMSAPRERLQMIQDIRSKGSFAPTRTPGLDDWISREVFSPPLTRRIRRRLRSLRKT